MNYAQRAIQQAADKCGFNINKKNAGDSFSKKSYSQCGEDMIINYIFQLRKIDTPAYLDIGSNHPYFLNNTAFFYEKGSRGINVDANLLLINEFNKYRPRDTNLAVGISVSDSLMDFYIMNDKTLSTFSRQECDHLISIGHALNRVEKVKLTTIEKILDQYCEGVFPDFLSLDVEGLDFEILQSINFEKSFPKVICVEAAEYSPIGAGARRNELIDFLVEKGYYEYANTNLNAIMVKKEFWFI